MRRALDDIAADPALTEAREALFLERFEVLPADAYETVRRLEESAVAAGYPVLA